MKDIKTGEYVRFENGVISQMEEGKIIGDFLFSEVVRISPDIIDLIEVGDYINGARVTNISKEQGKNVEIYLDTNDLFEQDIYKNEDIKSIVTKEVFERMEYRIGE